MRFPRTLLAVLATTVAAPLAAQAPGLRAAPSTRATAEVVLSYPRGQEPADAKPMSIKIDYGQPHLRGRTLHSDSLVPYGTVWRTGANAATALTTDIDLVIGGATVPKGSYTLYTLPSRTGWKLIINKNTGQWGTEYDEKHDLARVDLRARTLTSAIESLSIWLIPTAGSAVPRGQLRMAWGTVELSTDWSAK